MAGCHAVAAAIQAVGVGLGPATDHVRALPRAGVVHGRWPSRRLQPLGHRCRSLDFRPEAEGRAALAGQRHAHLLRVRGHLA
eukprot:6409541-Alexandrium_andersonii.AAC.1